MKSILKRPDDVGNRSRQHRSTLPQPSTTSDSVVHITAEDACLSTVPWSRSSGDRQDLDVLRSCRSDEVERGIDEDLQRVEEKLTRLERQLNNQFQQYERRLRSPPVKQTQHGGVYQESGPRYHTLADGRRLMSLQLNASGFDPRDIRVLVDRDQLLVEAAHSESHSAPVTSHDVTSAHSSDVTHRRLSRRYLLPVCVRAADLRCSMTSDGTLNIVGQVRRTGNDHVTSTGVNGAKTSGSSKHVKFDLS